MTQLYPPKTASKSATKKFAKELPDDWLACRETNHPWVPHTASMDRRSRCFDRTFRCPRCDALKIQVLTLGGAIVKSRIKYADGFLNTGFGRIVGEAKNELRRQSLLRMVRVLPDEED
jgi:hypothetical protein